MVTLSKELLDARTQREAAEKAKAQPAAPVTQAPAAPLVVMDKPRKSRSSRLTSPTAIKKMALDFSKAHRAGKFKRVGGSFLDAIEAATRNAVLNRVKMQPSVGKTLT